MKRNRTQSGRGYLFRVSSSSICNYNCLFCRPQLNEPVDILTKEEFAIIFSEINDIFEIKTVHFTGGEPLIRKDIGDLIYRTRKIGGNNLDIAITTNGSLLNEKIDEISNAGISRINVSLHTLNQNQYKKLTGTSDDKLLNKIIESIFIAVDRNITVKLNAVIIRNFNDNNIKDILDFSFENGLIVRFLEFGLYEPVNKWFDKNTFISHDEIFCLVKKYFGNFERDFSYRGNGPTKYYQNEKGNIFGILDNQSDPSCCGLIASE